MSVCSCPIAGDPRLCGRHGVVKNEHWRKLCQTKPAYFAAWEEGRGPGQNATTATNPAWQPEWDVSMPSRGLGDAVAKLTTKLGIKPCGGCKKRQKTLNKLAPFRRSSRQTTARAKPFTFDPGVCPEYVSTQQRVADAYRLAGMLPADTSLIIGVARSGLTVANLIAERLHLPVMILRPKQDIIEEGEGWRREKSPSRAGSVVLIDDNVLTGNSLQQDLPMARGKFPNLITAALYRNPNSHTKPDIFVRELKWPHVLEWNLFNSVLSPHIATDFDGILCVDPPNLPEGEAYETWLEQARPLYVPRRTAIPLIVTARREQHRPQTEAWLRRHGIAWNEMIMSPHATYAEAALAGIAEWKAKHVQTFFRRRHGIKPPLYVESDPTQAKGIAEAAGGFVVCPAVGKVFSPSGHSAGSGPSQPIYPPIERRNLIYHVYPSLANDDWKQNLDKLRPHSHLFNGKRVIAVASGNNTASADEVAAYLGWGAVQWHVCSNDPILRESATLPSLLAQVYSTDSNEATFFGHTKGNSTCCGVDGSRRWRNAMYHHLLVRSDECMGAMRMHAAVGTTKISWPPTIPFPWPSGLRVGTWMFAGTFFWFRHDQVFSIPNVMQVLKDRYGAEAWLGTMLPVESGFSVFQPFPGNYPSCRQSPYDPGMYSVEFDT